jgi:hypothetical protein
VWTNVTPAWQNLASDLSGISSNPTANDAYGATAPAADPTRPGVAYYGPAYQGVGKTTDYGLTWTQVFAPAGGFDGTAWRIAVSPDGTYVLALNGYGTSLGVWRSTNGGPNWTQVLGGDNVSGIAINRSDPNQVIVAPHGPSDAAVWYESSDAGQNFSSIGAQDAGIFSDIIFVSSTVLLARSPHGLQRMTKSGTWSSSVILADLEGPHGGSSFHYDAVRDIYYVGGLDNSDNRQKIWRSTNGGLGWTVVSDILGGGGYGPATVWGSTTKLFAQGNFATHGSYGPLALQADPATGTSWSNATVDAGVTNGAHCACVMTDGVRKVHITANDNAGVWRYIE